MDFCGSLRAPLAVTMTTDSQHFSSCRSDSESTATWLYPGCVLLPAMQNLRAMQMKASLSKKKAVKAGKGIPPCMSEYDCVTNPVGRILPDTSSKKVRPA